MKVYQVPLHNQRYEPNEADLIPHCEHISFGYCGDCRAKEKEALATIAELESKIEEMKKSHAAYEAQFGKMGAAMGSPQVFQGPAPQAPPAPVKLDLGCGNSTRRAIMALTHDKGWTGVDLPGTEGADVHTDLAAAPWPWPDNSVDEIHCAHMLEHVPRLARIHFFNEMHRVMKPGAKATLVTPHWASCRAYGDVTHEWPPVSEMFWGYLDKEWRALNAPHVGFICDFMVGYGYITAAWLQAEVANRNPEFVHKTTMEALQKYKEAAQDMMATLTARK